MVTNAMTTTACPVTPNLGLGWALAEATGVNGRLRSATLAADHLEDVRARLRVMRAEAEALRQRLVWAEQVRWVSPAARGYLRQIGEARVQWVALMGRLDRVVVTLSGLVDRAREEQSRAAAEKQDLEASARAGWC